LGMNFEGEWIEIFKAGSYPQGEFSEADIDEIVATYDPQLHEAPSTIGHPKPSEPAWGWVEAVRREGQLLLAKFRQVAPEFLQWLREGRFKKRSVRLSPHIVPGRWYLESVGWLGAMPPQVKGLADVALAAAEGELIIEFNDISDGGKEMEDKDVRALLDKQKDELEKSFAEREKRLREELTQKQEAAFSTEKQARERLEQENVKLRETLRRSDIRARLEKLLDEARITPAMLEQGLAEFCARLDDQEEVEFAQGDGGKASRQEWMFRFLGALPPVLEFREMATKERAAAAGGKTPAEFAGVTVDDERLTVHNQALALSREKGIPYEDALKQIMV